MSGAAARKIKAAKSLSTATGGAQLPHQTSEAAEEEEKMNIVEFIRSIDRLRLESGTDLEQMTLAELEALKQQQQQQQLRRGSTNTSAGSSSTTSSGAGAPKPEGMNSMGLRFLQRSRGRDASPASAPNDSAGSADSREHSPQQTGSAAGNGQAQPVPAGASVWRKNSAEAKSALRKKAFKNNRQETFHSLAMCSDSADPTIETANSSSAASLNEDLMRMPFVEGLTVGAGALGSASALGPGGAAGRRLGSGGGGAKQPFPPMGPTTAGANSNTNNTSTGCGMALGGCGAEQAATGTPMSQSVNPRRRVLHTMKQPDGSTVAFCTEEEEGGPGLSASADKSGFGGF